MTLTDDILLRYVDGLLAAAEVAAVEAALARDHVAAERVRLMRLSGAALRTEQDASPGAIDPDLMHRMLGSKLAAIEQSRMHLKRASARYVAAAAAVALLVGLSGGWFARHALAPVADPLPVWVQRVVDYHTLYARETVEGQRLALSEMDALRRRFSALVGRSVTIPTFGSTLEFRRGQVLQFEREPIIQLAYLPETGLPIALCFKRVDAADLAPKFERVNGIGMVRWRHDGLEFVLVGEQPEPLMRTVAKKAADLLASGMTQ
jgi:anti-sigma factor RsiW